MILDFIISIVGIYLLSGLVFAIPFLLRGIAAVDEGARGSKWGFRIVILPGTIIFWPLLLSKWIKNKKEND